MLDTVNDQLDLGIRQRLGQAFAGAAPGCAVPLEAPLEIDGAYVAERLTSCGRPADWLQSGTRCGLLRGKNVGTAALGALSARRKA